MLLIFLKGDLANLFEYFLKADLEFEIFAKGIDKEYLPVLYFTIEIFDKEYLPVETLWSTAAEQPSTSKN